LNIIFIIIVTFTMSHGYYLIMFDYITNKVISKSYNNPLQFRLWCPELPRKEGDDMLVGWIRYVFITTARFLRFSICDVICRQTR
jgi:hypothetical protein